MRNKCEGLVFFERLLDMATTWFYISFISSFSNRLRHIFELIIRN